MIKIPVRQIVIFLFCLLLAACASREEKELKKFVKDYDRTLQQAYATADLNVIAPLTMQGELKKLFPVFQALKTANSIMPSRIKKFRIKKTVISSDRNSAAVETYEEWEYWWEDRNTKQITKPKYTEKYPIRYYIVKDGGNWKVDHLELLEGR